MTPRQTYYRAIQVQVLFCVREHEHTMLCQGHRWWPVDALERLDTGLAIQQVSFQPQSGQEYSLVHIASGCLLIGYTVPTLVEAGIWLRKVKGLCDWTQPRPRLKDQPAIQKAIYLAWFDTLRRGDLYRRWKKRLMASDGEEEREEGRCANYDERRVQALGVDDECF